MMLKWPFVNRYIFGWLNLDVLPSVPVVATLSSRHVPTTSRRGCPSLRSDFQPASQCRDVPLRRGAELFFVVAAEVGRVLVADAETGAGGVEIFA